MKENRILLKINRWTLEILVRLKFMKLLLTSIMNITIFDFYNSKTSN